ncbi:hypothetical protein M0R45_030340 [Rubus argutus]|uniref:Non-haem dioxygenase N-terminal domain-containing protein n=1 Tax=Rubus argutus TaxID=59490 RepID=A0AAW1WCX6_RUBAR
MGSDSHNQIPAIDISTSSTELDRGTEEWNSLCKRVREACENYGCFEIVYDKIPLQLKAETFSMIRPLFNLPAETKKKNINPKPFHGYYEKTPIAPLYESFGIDDSSNYESFRSFTELMWPNGHDQFCNTVVTMVKKLDELKEMIEMMILDSYGLGEKLNSIIECKTHLRRLKLKPRMDNGSCSLSPTSYVFIVADLLMAWSNGRMHSLKHRAMMSGEKDQYSLGAFSSPVEGTIIKAEKELVDKEHPRILKDFDFKDFSRFAFTKEGSAIDSEMQVFAYAGIST